jgi:hypothetical protein
MAEESPPSITPELRDAFEQAMWAYKDWHRGMTEPNEVSMDLKPTAVSVVLVRVSQFEEPMPDRLWGILATVTRGGDDLPNDRSYRSAAEYLSRLINERKAHFERLNQADPIAPPRL